VELWIAGSIAMMAVYLYSGWFTAIHFDRERIEITVGTDHVHVRGWYHYVNSSWLPAMLTLGVPFPIDADHGPPIVISLVEAADLDDDGAHAISVRGHGEEKTFRLVFRPREGKWIGLEYVQPTAVTTGRYILRSTRRWRRAIGRADFALRVPLDLQPVISSYPPDHTGLEGRWMTYRFSRTDFYPVDDWSFQWTATSHRASAKVSP
jgi:hypothetical protein